MGPRLSPEAGARARGSVFLNEAPRGMVTEPAHLPAEPGAVLGAPAEGFLLREDILLEPAPELAAVVRLLHGAHRGPVRDPQPHRYAVLFAALRDLRLAHERARHLGASLREG